MSALGIVEVAEEYGLVTEEAISGFFRKATPRLLATLDSQFKEALERDDTSRQPGAGAFNYLASASFRAEQGCIRPECRARRMSEFARFSLLYADRVVFPIYLPQKHADRMWLEGTLRVIAEIRPLLDLGIILPTHSAPCICKNCVNEFSGAFEKVRDVAWEAANHIPVRFLGAKHGRKKYKKNEWTFHFGWPPDFESDIPPLLIVDNLPKILERHVTSKCSPGSQLPIDLVRDSGILMRFFQHASMDYVLQRIYGEHAACSYLSDSQREVRILESLLGSSPEAPRNSILASLAHDVPLFSNIPLETLVSVRQQDGDAFESYRAALNEAAMEAGNKGMSSDLSKEIYADIILPKLTALERKHDVLSTRLKGDSMLEFAVPIAAMVIGSLAGGSHSQAGSFLQMLGGVELVRSAGNHIKAIRSAGTALDSVKSDPLYFLLKMKRAYAEACESESRFLSH